MKKRKEQVGLTYVINDVDGIYIVTEATFKLKEQIERIDRQLWKWFIQLNSLYHSIETYPCKSDKSAYCGSDNKRDTLSKVIIWQLTEESLKASNKIVILE